MKNLLNIANDQRTPKAELTPGEQAMAEQEKQYQSFRENHEDEDDNHFDYNSED